LGAGRGGPIRLKGGMTTGKGGKRERKTGRAQTLTIALIEKGRAVNRKAGEEKTCAWFGQRPTGTKEEREPEDPPMKKLRRFIWGGGENQLAGLRDCPREGKGDKGREEGQRGGKRRFRMEVLKKSRPYRVVLSIKGEKWGRRRMGPGSRKKKRGNRKGDQLFKMPAPEKGKTLPKRKGKTSDIRKKSKKKGGKEKRIEGGSFPLRAVIILIVSRCGRKRGDEYHRVRGYKDGIATPICHWFDAGEGIGRPPVFTKKAK